MESGSNVRTRAASDAAPLAKEPWMGALILLLAALSGPSQASEQALAVPAEAIDAGPRPGEVEVRPSTEQGGPTSAGRWTRVGYSGYIAVWNQPGYSPSLLLGESVDLEVGLGQASVRSRLSTLRIGRSYLGIEAGLAATLRLSQSEDHSGMMLGVEGGAAWTTEGARWSLGPEIGWASVIDVRLGVAMTSMPSTAQQWSNLRGAHRGVQVTLTLRPNTGL